MHRPVLRATLLGLLLAGLAALPAAAQTIYPGTDYWVTPANGQTLFYFPSGDVEALCGAPLSNSWDHKVVLQGVPIAADYDTVVERLDKAVFDSSGLADTRIIVTDMSFASSAPQDTPCGWLNWRVKLSGTQSITTMKLKLTSSEGGTFAADIAVNVEFQAWDDSTNAYVGSLFYNIILPNPEDGTVWSFDPKKRTFRAGITPANDCLDVLRMKRDSFSPESSHYYAISDQIANGVCRK